MSASEQTQIRIERIFPASPGDVFHRWTAPEELEKWFWGSVGLNVSARVDLREGGQYRAETERPDGGKWVCHGAYQEIVPDERLVYTVNWEPEMGYESPGEKVTVEFQPEGRDTRVTFLHEGVLNSRGREEHRKGWGDTFDMLARLLEAD